MRLFYFTLQRCRVDLNLEVVDKNHISKVKVATIHKICGKRLHVKYFDADSLQHSGKDGEDSLLGKRTALCLYVDPEINFLYIICFIGFHSNLTAPTRRTLTLHVHNSACAILKRFMFY